MEFEKAKYIVLLNHVQVQNILVERDWINVRQFMLNKTLYYSAEILKRLVKLI